MVKIMENPIKHGMIWGVFPLFLETPMCFPQILQEKVKLRTLALLDRYVYHTTHCRSHKFHRPQESHVETSEMCFIKLDFTEVTKQVTCQ